PKIHGIIVMQPLPKHIHRVKVAQHISPQKDIDGMHALNLGKIINLKHACHQYPFEVRYDGMHALNLGKIMAEDKEALLPSTVKAVAEILKYYNIEVKGQTVCVEAVLLCLRP